MTPKSNITVRSERNINNGIKTTASTTPEQFWIYNNGITVLVHEYDAVGPAEDDLMLRGARNFLSRRTASR
jgi:hypothetical protein